MTALAVGVMIASAGVAEIGHVLNDIATVIGWLVIFALATLPLGRAIGRRLKRKEPLRLVVTGAVPDEWTRGDEVGDDTLTMVCPCCNAWSNDCICTADCGVPRCQMADPEVPRG